MSSPFFPKQVNRGMAIVNSTERYKNSQNSVGNVLLDLLHYCRHIGVDFGKELEFAKDAFQQDIENALEADPIEYHIGSALGTLSLVTKALLQGWIVARDGYLKYPNDDSNHWCSRWQKVKIDGITISVPHFLARRMVELGQKIE